MVKERKKSMIKTVTGFVTKLNRRRFTNNTQRVLHTLLASRGEWIPRSTFRTPSAGSRLRDLRKDRFGGFNVKCRSAASLGLRGGRHSFYYQLPRNNVTISKLQKVFEGVV
jgi:hypothetical protein